MLIARLVRKKNSMARVTQNREITFNQREARKKVKKYLIKSKRIFMTAKA